MKGSISTNIYLYVVRLATGLQHIVDILHAWHGIHSGQVLLIIDWRQTSMSVS